MQEQVDIVKSSYADTLNAISEHIRSLSFPVDSWFEDKLFDSDLYRFMAGRICIGYAAAEKDMLALFHITNEFVPLAPGLLERFAEEKGIVKALVSTQDPQLSALMAEWEYEKKMQACWFTDIGCVETQTLPENWVFRMAGASDTESIRDLTGDFFNEVSGGFSSLKERIAAETIFVLEISGAFAGAGVIEYSRIGANTASIGMVTNKEYRKMGVARTILVQLKQYVYAKGLIPVAGCWYYNTLSRKSLESAGMAATSIGYVADLKGRIKPPLRTIDI